MQQGLSSAANWAQGGGQGAVNSTLGAYNDALDPTQFLRAEGAYNPLTTYANQVGREVNRTVLPGLRDQANQYGQGGMYSSKRMQNEALARGEAAGRIGEFGANLTANLAGQGINARNAAMAMGPQMFDLGMQPGRSLYNLGEQQRAEQYTEQGMNNARTAFDQNEAYNRLSALGGQYAGYAGLGGTSSGTSNATQTKQQERDMLGTLVSLGQMGASLYTGMPMGGGGGGGFTDMAMGSMGGSNGLWGSGLGASSISPQYINRGFMPR